jgi:hypothetical protein
MLYKTADRFAAAISAWSGNDYKTIRPDIVSRAWFETNRISRDEIPSFISYMEQNGTPAYNISRMRDIHSKLLTQM